MLTYRLLTGTDPGAALESGPGFERMPPGGSRPAAILLRSAPAVDAVLGKAMSRRPEHRFDSIALFFRALEESLAGAAHVAGAVGVRGEPARTENTETTLAPTFDEPLQPVPSATTRNTARSMVAEAPAQGSARASLTQQFFAEGERQEATRWKDSPLVNDDEDDARDSRKVFDSFDRVPRRRAPFVTATALIIVGAAIAAWATGWRPRAVWFAISSGGASPAPAVTAPATTTTGQ